MHRALHDEQVASIGASGNDNITGSYAVLGRAATQEQVAVGQRRLHRVACHTHEVPGQRCLSHDRLPVLTGLVQGSVFEGNPSHA